MLLYKYRPWNEFAEQVLFTNSIFCPSKINLNDFAELIHPIKFETSSREIFRIKNNQINGDTHKTALLTAFTVSEILNHIEHGLGTEEENRKYSKYLNIKDKYQRIVEATYNEIDNIHDSILYYAISQFEDSVLLYCDYDEAVDRINNKLNKIGIISLSSKSDCPVMWAHYAQNHTGIVFIFDTSRDNFFAHSKEVEYVEDRREISLESIPGIFYQKAKDWSYEQEYRILSKIGDNCYKFDQQALVGIILGIRIDTETRIKIINIVKNHNLKINIFQAESSLTSFKIGFTKILL